MNTILLQVVNPNVNVTSILPEIIVAVTGIIVMLYDCFAPKQKAVTGTISLIGLILAVVSLFMLWSGNYDFTNAWNGMIVFDNSLMKFSWN
ncbi:MAG: hypothetical protein MUD14_18555 [Hydrococcus sp. Prado102]|nr:hypothetical protein [Hydrococcus sp. Prado102]